MSRCYLHSFDGELTYFQLVEPIPEYHVNTNPVRMVVLARAVAAGHLTEEGAQRGRVDPYRLIGNEPIISI